MSVFQYKAFISYSHADEKWARWLHRSLETYRVPRHIIQEHNLSSNRLIPIFRDREDLASSRDLSATIQEALENSENLIVVCSPSAAESHWVNEEIKQFKKIGKADRVFCLLVDEADRSFPPAALVDVDGDGYATSEETEPLAADARPNADGKQGAKLKIVASLLGIGLDRLRRREVQRRNRRLLTITTTATVGMVFSIGLAGYAFEQQQRAEAKAETSRQVTDFLLSTFKQANPEFYRSDEPSAREILQQGAIRVRHELSDRPRIRARLMATIGSAFLGIAQGKEAAELLSEALKLQEQQFGQSHPELVPTLQDLAFAKGSLEGDSETANRLNARALRIQEDFESPSSVGVADSLVKLSVFAADGERESLLLRALEIIETASPESKSHGQVLQNLAYHHLDQGELETSQIYLQQAAEFQQAKGRKQELVSTLSALGGVLGYMGEHDQSLLVLTRAVAVVEDIYGSDHPWTASIVNNLAVHHHILGNLEEAQPLYQRVLSIAENRLGPGSGLRRTALVNLGELERDRGAYQEAEAFFDECVRLDLETRGTVSPYLTGQIALLRLAQKRYDQARGQFERYFDQFDGKPSPDPTHAPIIEGYEQLLREAGEEPYRKAVTENGL